MHLFRAVIELLAITAGVAAVILSLAVGHSRSVLAKGPTNGLNRNVVVVAGSSPSASGVQAGFPSTSLTPDDVIALGNVGFVPDGVAVAPTAGLRTSVDAANRSANTDVVGSSSAFAEAAGYSLVSGRFISAADVEADSPVAVIGQTVANALFAGADPVGQNVVIDKQTFRVVGSLQARGYSGSYNQDNLMVIPITAAWKYLLVGQREPIDQVLISTAGPSQTKAAAGEAASTLLRRHDIVNPAEADFTIATQPQLVASQLETTRAMQRILELAGGVMLVAGAIHLASIWRTTTSPIGRVQPSDSSVLLAAAIATGLLGAAVGVVVALFSASPLHRLATNVPPFSITGHGLVVGVVLGVVAPAVSCVPALFQRRST